MTRHKNYPDAVLLYAAINNTLPSIIHNACVSPVETELNNATKIAVAQIINYTEAIAGRNCVDCGRGKA